jgi:hypothetical protein
MLALPCRFASLNTVRRDQWIDHCALASKDLEPLPIIAMGVHSIAADVTTVFAKAKISGRLSQHGPLLAIRKRHSVIAAAFGLAMLASCWCITQTATYEMRNRAISRLCV